MKRAVFAAAAVAWLAFVTPGSAQVDQHRMAAEVIAAASSGDIAAVRSYLAQGYAVNTRRGGMSALTVAVVDKRTEMVRFLLSQGADPNSVYQDDYVSGYEAGVPVLAIAERAGNEEIAALLRAAGARGAPAVAQVRSPPPAPPAPVGVVTGPLAQRARQGSAWPDAGQIGVGGAVLFSTSGGERWKAGTVREIGTGERAGLVLVFDPALNDRHWVEPSRVVRPAREAFWTGFFVGDWELNTGMAVTQRTDGRDVYRIVTGGLRLPPLRINADGTYAWRATEGGRERLVRGRWKPREDAPGIVLLGGPRDADWTLWHTSTRSTRDVLGRDEIRVSGPSYSWLGHRLPTR